ncbi:MAG: Crp/Fnr family transcriptional regulator [Alphaproteobacteria bacterium]|jgi:CRP/FNR family transcriptional regulator, dissimilatory nitrate respiration regulator|nr:Crp/Fnr family transcriptional regulator [Alphaproteobacteria bacterium]MBT7943972.1 Crp/Fnr family transcriptional regulator [Alphaproteobacteria bacterium]
MLQDDDLSIIRQIPLFENMSDEALVTLLGHSFPKEYPKGKVLFVRDEPADCFYIVLSGWVKIYRETQEGDEAVLGVFARGESLAEAAAFLGMNYPASAQVIEQARLLPILSKPFRSHISDMPEIAMNMLASMSKRAHQHVAEIEQLKTRSATLRVVDFLLKLCPVEEGSAVVSLPYDKTLISRRLGMQPESLSRILAKLRKQGVKTELNRVMITDISSLVDFSNGVGTKNRAETG